MKTEFIDVNETQKTLVVEIPSAVVDAEIERVARDYSRAARIPGFRPGRVPPRLVRQRFRDQILKDVAQDLIPRAVDEALRERGEEPVDTPNIRDVSLQEGQPLKFTAAYETVPPIDPGNYAELTIRKPPAVIETTAVDEALGRLRERYARFEPVEDRAAAVGDTLTVDIDRQPVESGAEARADASPTRHENVALEIGAAANPPGLDDEVAGMRAGESKTFVLRYPDDYPAEDLAGRSIRYSVTVQAVRRKVLPGLDDEFAKEVGAFESLEALRQRVRDDLLHEAEHEADRQVRADLLEQLASRVAFPVPAALVDREIDRRVEDFVHRLIERQVDPRRANINWEEFREQMRAPSMRAVQSALVLDEVARREQLTTTEAEVTAEIERYAARTGRTPAAVKARLEKEGGLGPIHAGLRREKAIDFVLSRATIAAA